MNRQRLNAWMLGLGIAILSLGSAIDAQKGKPPAPVAATALFRCPGELCPAADPTSMPPVLTDAVTGDQYEMVYGAADGSQIDSAGEFALFLKPNGRSLWLDFANGPAPCAGCRRTFASIAIDAAYAGVFHSNVIDPATGNEASLGLRSIPVGATWRSRLKVAFNTVSTSGQTIQWAVRFNPRDYYPSDHISVTRTATKQWVLLATSAERAMLVSVCCRQKTYTNEGLYAMPFSVTVNEP